MILGLTTFAFVHTLISLVGIGSGLVVLSGLLRSQRAPAWTIWFLATTVATSVTGFLFPFHGVTPALVVGALSMILLATAIAALYVFHLVGPWRWIYVVTAVMALYFNVFVLVVQSFLKIPGLHRLAPTQGEPPFAIAQGLTLLVFISLGVLAVRRFKSQGEIAGVDP